MISTRDTACSCLMRVASQLMSWAYHIGRPLSDSATCTCEPGASWPPFPWRRVRLWSRADLEVPVPACGGYAVGATHRAALANDVRDAGQGGRRRGGGRVEARSARRGGSETGKSGGADAGQESQFPERRGISTRSMAYPARRRRSSDLKTRWREKQGRCRLMRRGARAAGEQMTGRITRSPALP